MWVVDPEAEVRARMRDRVAEVERRRLVARARAGQPELAGRWPATGGGYGGRRASG